MTIEGFAVIANGMHCHPILCSETCLGYRAGRLYSTGHYCYYLASMIGSIVKVDCCCLLLR